MIRLILAEDHCLVRKGVRALLAGEPSMEIIAEAADGNEAAELTEKLSPDVLLLDLSLPRMHGLAVIRRLAGSSKTRILVLTMHADGLNVRDALAAGAMGYMLKDCTPEELVLAIRTVVQGKRFVAETLRKIAIKAVVSSKTTRSVKTATSSKTGLGDAGVGLTPRERLVLEESALGLTSAEIAKKLFISSRTVESHRAHFMEKLKLSNQTELVRFAIREGIISV